MIQILNKHRFSTLTLLGLLLASCTSGTIPYAGQPAYQLIQPGGPSDLPVTPSPSSIPTSPSSGPVDPSVLQITDVQPRDLSAGETLTVTGAALDRIGSGDVRLAWVFDDRSLPAVVDQQSATRLRLTFPTFPAGRKLVSLHLLVGGKAQQGYVLGILPGATGTPFPSLPPSPSPTSSASPSASTSPAASDSPSASVSPSASPTASDSPAASASPAASDSASPTTSPSPTPSPSASADAGQTSP